MPTLSVRHLIAPLAAASLYSCASAPPPAGGALSSRSTPKPTKPRPAATQAVSPKASLAGAAQFGFEKPKEVKGIYLTAWSAGSKTKMDKMLGLLDRTELNSVVIDVRDT